MQLIYLAIVSREVAQIDFALFAVALIVASFGVMLVQTSIGRATARRIRNDIEGDRALVTVAAGSGLIFAGVVAAISPLIASIWALPQAAAITAVMAMQVPLAGVNGVQASILRRMGRVPMFATLQVVGAALGVAAGIAAAVRWQSVGALAVQPLLSVLSMVLLMGVILGKRSIPGRVLRGSLDDLAFGVRSGYSGLLNFIAFGIPQWAMSTALGPLTFANWNRAVTVAQVPVDLMGRSIATVVYPLFRNHRGSSQVSAKWTGMLSAFATVIMPLTGIVLPIVPALVGVIIGNEWVEAQAMAPWVLIAAVIGLQSLLLTSALESSRHFPALMMGQYVAIPILIVASILVLVCHSWIPAVVGFIAAAAVVHGIQIIGASKLGLIDGRTVVRRYAIVAITAGALAFESAIVHSYASTELVVAGNVALAAGIYGFILFKFRLKWDLMPSRW